MSLRERADDAPERLVDKDAHDIYRVLIDTPTDALVEDRVLAVPLAGDVSIHDVFLLFSRIPRNRNPVERSVEHAEWLVDAASGSANDQVNASASAALTR
jgi:hypothetical protein